MEKKLKIYWIHEKSYENILSKNTNEEKIWQNHAKTI